MEITPRDIANAIWLGIFLLFILVRVRAPAWAVVKAFCAPAILRIWLIAALYIVALVMALRAVGLWEIDNLKVTLLWSLTVAGSRLLGVNKISEERGYFGKAVREAIAVTAITEFLISKYTFSLWAELLLVPFFGLLVTMSVVAEREEKFALVKRLLQGVLAIVGLIVLGHALYEAVDHLADIRTMASVREIVVPMALSLAFLPFLHLLNVYMVYEVMFATLYVSIADDDLRRYAQRRAIWAFRGNLDYLKRWRRLLNFETVATRADVDRLLAELRVIRRHERHATAVEPSLGWSPRIARGWLEAIELEPEDYHRSFQLWLASGSRSLGESWSMNRLTGAISGMAFVVTQAGLKLSIRDPTSAAAADTAFEDDVGRLLALAVGDARAKALTDQLAGGTGSASDDLYLVSLARRTLAQPETFERRFLLRSLAGWQRPVDEFGPVDDDDWVTGS